MTQVYSFNKAVDSARLELEILLAGLGGVYDHVHRTGFETVNVVMQTSLSPAQATSLTGIINAHIADPLPPDQPTLVTKINGLSGVVTFEVDETLDGVTAEQLTEDIGRMRVGALMPSPSGAYLNEIAGQLANINSSGVINSFGIGFADAEMDGESSSNSTAYQQKVRLTTPSLAAGRYRIGWSFEWKGSKTDDGGQEFRVQLDDSTVLMEVDPSMHSKMRDKYIDSGGFKHIALTTGVHTIDLDYRAVSKNEGHHGGGGSSSSKNTVTVRRARLEIWRVS